MTRSVRVLTVALLAMCLLVTAAAVVVADDPIRLGVFIPGRLGDSPPYDDLAEGAEQFALRNDGLDLVRIFEAGFDQSQWPEMLLQFAASGEYDVIYTSNEAMGPLCVGVMEQVPDIKFIVNDAYVLDYDRLYTTFFNNTQQAFLFGYMMALISTSDMENVNPDKKVGLVFGQHYVMMDEMIIPGMEQGAQYADPEFELVTTMLGNWYDAAKAEQLANTMADQGVDVFGSICGSGNAGVLSSAVNNGLYVLWYDDDGFDKAPGTVVASFIKDNKAATIRNLERLVEGTLPWGEAEVLGAEQGYIYVPLRDAGYVSSVPEAVRNQFKVVYDQVVSGELEIAVPQEVLDTINAASH
ncbi:MAG: BMP family ABC transporter substrate-binding protein [Candidatus Bipolaricaulota bacterium]|nr:MAG: BMP family ABC transporter substrate-binding protein [Candidatus Bipolaricaulota bacterium]